MEIPLRTAYGQNGRCGMQPKAKHSLRAQAQLMRTETVETFELVKKLLDMRAELEQRKGEAEKEERESKDVDATEKDAVRTLVSGILISHASTATCSKRMESRSSDIKIHPPMGKSFEGDGKLGISKLAISCIAGDAEEGLTPELDGKADILDVEGTLLRIGFTGSDSDIAAIGDVDVKRSA
ncbi:hypothetical protein TNCV_1844211 [Trichonephila clavipes]|nr:hypothetical protein TNCV_1844211 [Trichonephila clavipes]